MYLYMQARGDIAVQGVCMPLGVYPSVTQLGDTAVQVFPYNIEMLQLYKCFCTI